MLETTSYHTDPPSHNESGFHSDDATWILTSAFIIFTMQSGFGLLEAGLVSGKNETNIMVKNAIDVIYGGLAYWIFGFGISFGQDSKSNWFTGWGNFFVDSDDLETGIFAKYFFQLSFATTATTIVSGAMAERVNIKAYIAFSFFNTISYAFPAHWLWDKNGFLYKMRAVDVAGCGPVHLVGGVSGIVAAIMLKPRKNKFDENGKPRDTPMASPTNVLLGTFMLWWGWLGFNCGSTFGTSGDKWKIASRSAVVTINGSVGGGILGMTYSFFFYKKKLLIGIFVTGILGGLVSVTAICTVSRPWEALIIGFIGGLVATLGLRLEEKMQIDDPVGAFPTHALASIWGLIATALFCEPTIGFTERFGLFKGGSWEFLGVQLLVAVCCSVWSAITTFLLLFVIDKIIGLRMSEEEEEVGADIYVHNILPPADDSRTSRTNISLQERHDEGWTIRSRKTSYNSSTGSRRETKSDGHEVQSTSSIDTNKLREINPCASQKILGISNTVAPRSKSSSTTTVSENQHDIVEGTNNDGFQNC